MPLPASALLDVSCPIKPAWAVFDADWYKKAYFSGVDRVPEDLLIYYLQSGCRAGHSPNCFFDEPFYLARNPDIATLVQAGHFRSGFDHFCQFGHRSISPHWLFDDAYYAELHEDMAIENLDLHGFFGRYDHYLKIGQHEHRSAHLLFDGRFYQAKAIAAGDAAERIETLGAFTHYLLRLQANEAELPPSIYFDPAWYLDHHPDAPVLCPAVAHYLFQGAVHADAGDPVPEFSEAFYLENDADVRQLVAAGKFRNGYDHFLTFGAFELRRPSAGIDLTYYRDANGRVRHDLNSGAARDAFAHLRSIGLKLGLMAAPPGAQPQITEAATKQLFIRRARDNLALFARRKLDFSSAGQPMLSVVMVLFEKFELTMRALCALRENYPHAIELIIVDNASTDESRRIGDYVDGAIVMLLDKNTGYARACNLGLAKVTCPFVLLLNNDVELGFGAVAAAIARLQSDDRIGAVGGKVIRTHGRLQEAGSIIWRDGAVAGYMRDASPLASEANFVRDVDFCSGVFLLCRAALLEELGGFDADFSPAYYEDADLCVRIAEAGHRIVYDPDVVIHHLEFGSAAYADASMALMRRGQKIFIRKHAAFLRGKLERRPEHAVFARAVTPDRKKILFIEDVIPLRWLGSGYVRANDIVQAIAATHDVSVFPMNGAPQDIMRIYAGFPDNVELLHDRDFDCLAEFLKARPGFYDAIWISRTHNLNRVLPVLRATIDPAVTPLILDTEAIATLRDAARAELADEKFDFAAKLREEFANVATCRQLIAVNPAEAGHLREIGLPAVSVLGTMRAPQPTQAAFSEREGLLFVAAIHQQDSPNLDALHWYADAILPALAARMAQVPLLTVIGYAGPEIDLSRFARHPHIKIHGPAGDLRPFYDRARVFIAPTRFAAGTPYKLYETAGFGLPCVATELLAQQLGWRDNVELLTAAVGDANGFAGRIAHLYQSERDWNELRGQALGRLASDNSPAAFNATVSCILGEARV